MRLARALLAGLIVLAPGAAAAQTEQMDQALDISRLLLDPPEGVDLAYGAFQRGYYLTALRLAERRAGQGDAVAQTLIAEIYANGLGVAQDIPKAISWYAQADANGDIQATFQLAMIYQRGTGIGRNRERAAQLFEKAAAGGHLAAKYNLGLLYVEGIYVEPNLMRAAELIGEAAEAGLPEAQYDYAVMLLEGAGIAPNTDEALDLLAQAAEQGLAAAQVEYATLLYMGARGGTREAEEAADRQRLRAEAIATRIALCERVETLDGEDVLAQLVPIEEEWRSLLPLVDNGPEADRLAERFAQAVAACRKRHEMGALLHETRAALEARLAEAEGLVSTDDAAGAEAAWQSLDRDARGLASVLDSAGSPAPELMARLEAVGQVFAARQAEREAAAGQAREAALQQLQRIVERARRVAEAESITLREGDRLIRDITAAIDQASRIGGSKDIDTATSELRALQAAIAPRVHELREMDEWRRFANAQRQEQLITMADAIVASLKEDELAGKETDLEATARALRELHAEWQKVAEGPRQNAQRLWERFRSATDVIRSRCEPYFAKRREERQAASSRREAIVVEAESLATSSDWTRTAARIQELQKEWQSLGRPAGDKDRELFQRFAVRI